jgi:Flp pilus assembly protein TadG
MKRLNAFLRDCRGTSAIEFAVIAPVLAGLLVGGWDAWLLINRKQDMHAAVNAGAHYYMGGGTNDTTGHDISISSWPNHPGDGAITISRACTCAGAGSDCNTVCAATQQAPEIRVTLNAQEHWDGLQPANLVESETVRVR